MKKNLLRALALSVVTASGLAGMSAHAADQAVVDALKASLDKASELGALYLQSVPFAGESTRNAIEKTLPEAIANVNDIAAQFPDAASAEAYVNAEVVKIEEALLADIQAKVTEGDAFSFEFVKVGEAGLPSYFSSSVSAVDVTDSGLITTNEISAGNLFRAELKSDNAFALYTVNTNQQVTTNFYTGSGAYSVNIWGRHKTKPNFVFALKDGYVQLISQLEDKNFALAYNDEKGYTVGLDKNDAKTLFKLQAYDLATVADMAAEQLTSWGTLVPSGDKVATSANAEINAAADVASIGAVMVKAKNDMIANIASAPVKIKSEATGLYVGYEDSWWATFEEADAHDWTLTLTEKPNSYPDYYLFKDDTEGKYIGWSFGLQAVDSPNANVGSYNSSYFVVMLDNPANITLFKGANGSSNGIVVEGDKLTVINKMATRYIDGIENFSFSFERNAAIETLTNGLNEAAALGALYLESIPFAGEAVRNILEDIPEAIANISEIAKEYNTPEKAEAYITAVISTLEEELLADIQAKITEGDAFSFQFVKVGEAGLPSYLSTSVSAVDVTDSGLITTNEISAGNLFRAELKSDNAFALYTVNTNQQVTTNFYTGSGAYSVNIWGRHKTKPNFVFALKDGYVQLISQLEDKNFALAYNDEKGYVVGLDKSDAKTLFKLQAYDLATVADMTAEQLTSWGALVPAGNNVADAANEEISAADDVASIAAVMVKAKNDMITNIADGTVKIKSEATGLYVGYEDSWWATFEEADAHDWTLTLTEKPNSYPDYYLFKDDTEGKYIGWSFGLQAVDSPNANVGSYNSSYFVIMLDNPANITLFKGANGSSNGIVVADDKLTVINKMATRYIDGIENFSFSFERNTVSDGIGSINVEEDSEAVIFDLTGRRVINPDRGFYIINGKKVLIK